MGLKPGRRVGKCADRVQRVGLQRVVPDILVAAKRSVEVVPLVLADAQTRDVVGIASISEVAQVETIEEQAVMIERPHLQGHIQQARALLQIHESIVGGLIAGDVGEAVAKFHRLLDIVIS